MVGPVVIEAYIGIAQLCPHLRWWCSRCNKFARKRVESTNRRSTSELPWKVGQQISVVASTKHIWVCRDKAIIGSQVTVDDNISKARGADYSILAAGFHVKFRLNPSTVLHIWQTFVIPVLLYGFELFALSEKLISKVGVFQTRLCVLLVACWTTDHYRPCSNLGVGISEGCFIFDI